MQKLERSLGAVTKLAASLRAETESQRQQLQALTAARAPDLAGELARRMASDN